MEETWTVGSVPDDVEDVAERVTSMARLKRRHTQAIETERRLAQKTEALQSTLEALPAVVELDEPFPSRRGRHRRGTHAGRSEAAAGGSAGGPHARRGAAAGGVSSHRRAVSR